MDPKAESRKRPDGWRGAEVERKRLIREARQAYDADGLLALLESAPGNYPNLQELRLWARIEKQRQAQLEYSRQHRRWDRVLALLESAPPDYPNLDRLRAEALAAKRHDQLDDLLHRAGASLAAGRPTETLALCRQALAMGGDQTAFAALRAQALANLGEAEAAEPIANAAIPTAIANAAEARVPLLEPPPGETTERPTKNEPLEAKPAATGHGAVAESRPGIDLAATELAGGRWRKALTTLAELPAADVSNLPETDRRRLARLALDASAAAETAREWPAAVVALQLLAAWGTHDEYAEQRRADVGRKQEADRLVTVAQAAFAAGNWQEALEQSEAAARASPGFGGAQDLVDLTRHELAKAVGRRRHTTVFRAVPAALLLLLGSAVTVWGAQTGNGPAGFLASVSWPAVGEPTNAPSPPADAAQTATVLAVLQSTALETPSPTLTETQTPTPTASATPAASPPTTNTPLPPTSTTRPAARPTVYTATPVPPAPPPPTNTRVPPTRTQVPPAPTTAPPQPTSTPWPR